jgi:hypothetical protein
VSGTFIGLQRILTPSPTPASKVPDTLAPVTEAPRPVETAARGGAGAHLRVYLDRFQPQSWLTDAL